MKKIIALGLSSFVFLGSAQGFDDPAFQFEKCPFQPEVSHNQMQVLESVRIALQQIAKNQQLDQTGCGEIRFRAENASRQIGSLAQSMGQFQVPVDSSSFTFTPNGIVTGEERADTFKVNCDNYELAYSFEHNNHIGFSERNFDTGSYYSSPRDTSPDYFQCYKGGSADRACLDSIYEFKLKRRRTFCASYRKDVRQLSTRISAASWAGKIDQELSALETRMNSVDCPDNVKATVRTSLKTSIATLASVAGFAVGPGYAGFAVGVAGNFLSRFMWMSPPEIDAYKKLVENEDFEKNACVYVQAQQLAMRCAPLDQKLIPSIKSDPQWVAYLLSPSEEQVSLRQLQDTISKISEVDNLEEFFGASPGGSLSGSHRLPSKLIEVMESPIGVPTQSGNPRPQAVKLHLLEILSELSNRAGDLSFEERMSLQYLRNFLSSYDKWLQSTKSVPLDFEKENELRALLIQNIKSIVKMNFIDRKVDDKNPQLVYGQPQLDPAVLKYWQLHNKIDVIGETYRMNEIQEANNLKLSILTRSLNRVNSPESKLYNSFNLFHGAYRKRLRSEFERRYSQAKNVVGIPNISKHPQDIERYLLPLMQVCTLTASAYYLDEKGSLASAKEIANYNKFCEPLFCKSHGFLPFAESRQAGQFSEYQCAISGKSFPLISEGIFNELIESGTICGFSLRERFYPSAENSQKISKGQEKQRTEKAKLEPLGSRSTPDFTRLKEAVKIEAQVVENPTEGFEETGTFLVSQPLSKTFAEQKLAEAKSKNIEASIRELKISPGQSVTVLAFAQLNQCRQLGLDCRTIKLGEPKVPTAPAKKLGLVLKKYSRGQSLEGQIVRRPEIWAQERVQQYLQSSIVRDYFPETKVFQLITANEVVSAFVVLKTYDQNSSEAQIASDITYCKTKAAEVAGSPSCSLEDISKLKY